jgi:DNA polymerase III delta subunit
MDLNDFKTKLKSGDLGGCYIFAGEEDYLKRYYLSSLRDAIIEDDTLAAFNHALYEGADIDFPSVRDAIKAPPLFAERKLIEWRYPSFEKMKESDLRLFEETLELLSDFPYATLAFIVSEGDIDLGAGKKVIRLA